MSLFGAAHDTANKAPTNGATADTQTDHIRTAENTYEMAALATAPIAEAFALDAPAQRVDGAAGVVTGVFDVPFYSQFEDVSSPAWKGAACGITSLAMVIEHYQPNTVSVDALLSNGIAAGAYLPNVGWTYQGLIGVAKERGLSGRSYDLATVETSHAFTQMKEALLDGPVITSVYYGFKPYSAVSHLVVVTGVYGDTLYYNDPAADSGSKTISSSDFLRGWKKRYIVVRPVP